MSNAPYCSITLSTRNKAGYLDVAMASIARQVTPFRFEIIVVDDGSTDNTEAICRQYGVRYFRLNNDRYRNPSVARNVAFRAARGDVIVGQCDDIVYVNDNSLETLVDSLTPGYFSAGCTHNYRYHGRQPVEYIEEYCGRTRPVPYFFCGAVYRDDVYAIGGYDEEFVEPCYDDNWFADCLLHGLGLSCTITEQLIAHHQFHGYPSGSHVNEEVSKKLYIAKRTEAEESGIWQSSGGPWTTFEVPVESRPTPVTDVSTFTPPVITRTASHSTGDIPKLMHFFWAGDVLSWMRYMTLFSFRYYHRDWDIVLHTMPLAETSQKRWGTPETPDSDTYVGPNYLDHLPQLSIDIQPWTPLPDEPPELATPHACDLCQWQVLATDGGFYADMDILFVGELPYHQVKNAGAVFCLSNSWMTIGLMAATPNQPVFRDIRESALDNYLPTQYQSTGAEAVYRLAGFYPGWASVANVGERCLEVFRLRYPELQATTLPQHTVYPWAYTETAKIFEETRDIPPGCCGIHWFGGNSLSQGWNSKLTSDNYRKYPNTFTRYVSQILGDAHAVDVTAP